MHLRDFTRHPVAAFVKGIQRLNFGLLVLFLLASSLPQCQGKGMFEVHFLDYSNPGQRDSQTKCCSGQEVQGRCPSPCSTFFSVCLRPQVASSCLFGQESTEVLGNSSFVIPSNSLLLVPWHVSLETFQGSFSLVVAAKHKGVFTRVLIEEAVVTRQQLQPSAQWYNVTHIGTVANISFSYRMVCEQNYYGNSCSRLCIPRNDAFGHYSCDSNGNRVCLPGWSNVASYCTTAVCRVGCHPNHGSCQDRPNECNCADGWQGANCSECKPHPACHRGTCTQPWECNCYAGWGGKYCDLDLEYCARKKPCKNGALCTNVRAGNYACSCKKGYTGRNCETEINECSSHPCFNGGNCTDLLGDFNCTCPQGYGGKQCYPECLPGACKNGGTCVNGIRGYHCMCNAGFTGNSCEELLPTTSPTNQTTNHTLSHSSGQSSSHPSSSSSGHPSSSPSSHPASTPESTSNDTTVKTTTAAPTKNETIGQSYNSERGSGKTSRTAMIVAIVVSVLVFIILIAACVAWKFWRKRKRRRDAEHEAAGSVKAAQANPKQIDIEDPDPKYSAGARSGNPEIIRNFVSSKQQEKNTNKAQEHLGDAKKLKETTVEDSASARSTLELSDITTATSTKSTTRATTRMNLDELYLPNRCYDQGFFQEVELEI